MSQPTNMSWTESNINTSLCNSTNLSNFVLMVTTFRYIHHISVKRGLVSVFHARMIVLTYNRPKSLTRLLNSLERSDYSFSRNNPHWRLILEIRVDGGGGREVTFEDRPVS